VSDLSVSIVHRRPASG